MKIYKFIVLIILVIQVCATSRAETYRECINNKMSASLKAKPCKLDQMSAAKTSAESACAQAMFDELMADKTLKVGNGGCRTKALRS